MNAPATLILWPHQSFGISEVARLRTEGVRRICLTSPTGGGKSVIICEMIADEVLHGRGAVLYTNRKMLREQLSGVLDRYGIHHGIRAAGEEEGLDRKVQVSSLQTEHSRVYRSKQWALHPASLVIIDEAHMQKGAVAQQIMKDHLVSGATIVGVTATPLDLDGLYDELIVAGVTSELRKCGALVRADHFAPDEPEAKMVVRKKTGEVEIDGKMRAIWSQHVFGRVLSEWKRLNPEQKPTILFAPGVGESVWFAQQFHEQGISAAHIDGDECWVNGNAYASDRAARDGILGGVRSGEIKVVCNRFVLREGIDLPELEHGILATVFGSLQSFLQSGGRLLRAAPGKTVATIQDHGGNFWRHGSLNVDRLWKIGDTARVIEAMRTERLQSKVELEPIVCPKCHACRMSGPQCWKCGFAHHRKARIVIQADGKLREQTGDIFRPKATRSEPDSAQLWKQMYYRARNGNRTFRQAEALFFMENGYYPSRDLPLMPRNEADWYRRVPAVAIGELTS